MTTQIIGTSVQSRNITAQVFDVASPLYKCLVLGGQHGDENEGIAACANLVTDITTTNPSNYTDVSIAVISPMNPDGQNANTRENANTMDLNRNHTLASEPEIRAVHSFIRSWRPNMLIDVHNFPSTQTYMNSISPQRAFSHDCMVDKPTNPCVRHDITKTQLNTIISDLNTANSGAGYTYHRYFNPSDAGRVRWSTEDIIDARNFISFRYNCLGFIFEGREGLSSEENLATQSAATQEAEFRALKHIINWGKSNTNLFASKVCPCVSGSKYNTKFTYKDPSGESITVDMWNRTTHVVEPFTFIWFVETLEVDNTIIVPLAYAIHETNEAEVITLLENQHGLIGIDGTTGNQYDIETIHIDTADAWVTQTDPADMDCPGNITCTNNASTMTNFSSYRIYNVDQEGGHVLPLLLEPLSEYALTRYKTILGLDCVQATNYSILRLINKLA